MRHEHSYGIIPLKQEKGKWKVLLVRHQSGHFSFPKGHSDPNETPQETAIRELEEETGLKIVDFLPLVPLEEHYFFTFKDEKISKTVTYFPALVKGKVRLQHEELADFLWSPLEKAEAIATFPEAKRIIRTLITSLK